jgi:putative acetyltransferase|eukprot:gene17805-12756_t
MSEVEINRECKFPEDTAEMIDEVHAYTSSLYRPENVFGFKPSQLEHPKIHFLVARINGYPVACGGVKLYDENPDDVYCEVKRMYVRAAHRGKGLAKKILSLLEDQARAMGVRTLRLETGIYQPDAISLYEKVGYTRRGIYGDYKETDENVFFEKTL